MSKNVFEMMSNSEPVDVRTATYQPAREEMARTGAINYEINQN